MNAVISGRAGLALFIDGESLMSLDVDDLGTLVPRSPYDLRFLLADATDLVTLENTDRDQVAERLDLEHDIACALDMTLIALDPGTSMELRAEAVGALDELLARSRVIERLEFTMYAKPLPDSADLMGAMLCTEVTTAAARSFFERLERHQAAISAVRESWNALPDHLFGDEPAAKAVFHDVACNEGLFRLLSLSYGDRARVSEFLLEALKNRSISSLRNYRDVVQQWCAPIRAVAGVDAPVIESEYDGYEKTPETPAPSTVRDSPRRQSVPALGKAPSETELAALVRRIIAGETRAEDEMVRRYEKRVSIVIGRIVQGQSVTEDLSQDTLMIALEKIRRGDVRDPERLSGFIHAVARNRAVEYLRKSRWLENQEGIGKAEQIPDPAPSPLEALCKEERILKVRHVIDELRVNRDREVLLRYYIAEENKDQICADLGLTRPQLDLVIYRAVQRYKVLYVKLRYSPSPEQHR